MNPKLQQMLKEVSDAIDEMAPSEAASVATIAILTMILEEVREINGHLKAKE